MSQCFSRKEINTFNVSTFIQMCTDETLADKKRKDVYR